MILALAAPFGWSDLAGVVIAVAVIALGGKFLVESVRSKFHF